MKDASQYPITTPFGQVPGYELNNGFHRGEDRAMPTGTPIMVNGVTIGLSGNTGASTGPHLHIGKWNGGTVLPPNGGGFSFANAVVIDVGYDTTNGNYVKLQADGYQWVYLHESQVLAIKGQSLKGAPMAASQDIADETVIRLMYDVGLNRDVTPDELKARLAANQTVEQLMRDIWTSLEHDALLNKVSGINRDVVVKYVQENLK